MKTLTRKISRTAITMALVILAFIAIFRAWVYYTESPWTRDARFSADVVAIAMHSVQEYLDYADSWQISEAHELADTGAFDVIYGAGCHCAQPIENYNGTWIIYGLGNAVTESANTPETLVNNQGVTARIQFAGKKGVKGSWRVNRIDWVPTANVHQGNYQWCPISSDHPIGTCWDEAYDAQIRQRIWDVIYSMGADQNVVKEWNITQEQAAKQ